jgi:1,4-dihydroxy-2-naphthoyl-CoA hydrolase
MLGQLGIQITEQTVDRCSGTMPIDKRTIQPAGVAHGGALITLADTLASLGTICNIDPATQFCVGQEINASLLRPLPKGSVAYGVATVLHRGRTSMVWEVRITNPEGKLAAACRCTIAIRPLQRPS